MKIVKQTDFKGLKKVSQGKVRDIYDLGGHLLIVTTDRISAFDVVLPDPIPRKGFVLNQISAWWFQRMTGIMPHHMVSVSVDEFPKECLPYRDDLEGRSMLVKKARPLPVECIVPRLPDRHRAQGLSENRPGLRHRAATGADGVQQAGAAHLHPLHQGRPGLP
jgi:phosphoribosylaminoimidazole-succinocarboxamide synthase